MKIRQLKNEEEIPYKLLLLADETVEAINKYIFQSEIYVIESNGLLIAVCVLNKLNEKSIEIKNIAVAEKHQGQGIGEMLLNDSIEKAKNNSFKEILIGTGDASIKQLYLYQKVGFEMYEIKSNFFINNYPEPIFENGIQLKHMIMLKKDLK